MSQVHVEDLSELTTTVADYAINNPRSTAPSAESKGWENLIYSGVETHTWKPVTEILGDLLHVRNDVKNSSAVSIGEGEGFLYMFGGNSFLAKSNKAASFGWKPRQKDLISTMRDALIV